MNQYIKVHRPYVDIFGSPKRPLSLTVTGTETESEAA